MGWFYVCLISSIFGGWGQVGKQVLLIYVASYFAKPFQLNYHLMYILFSNKVYQCLCPWCVLGNIIGGLIVSRSRRREVGEVCICVCE